MDETYWKKRALSAEEMAEAWRQKYLNVTKRPNSITWLFRLTKQERLIFDLLMTGSIVSHSDIAIALWNRRIFADNTVATCVSRLRRKLRTFGLEISILYRAGYYFTPEALAQIEELAKHNMVNPSAAAAPHSPSPE